MNRCTKLGFDSAAGELGGEGRPTLTTGVGTRTILGGNPPAAVDQKFLRFIPPDAIAAAPPGSEMTAQQRTGWSEILARLQRIYRGGARLLDGTDALMTGVFFGPSLHWELQFFNQADIPPAQILRMATADAAEIDGASADLGDLEPGKLDDLLLLNASPLDDVRNTMKIWRVIQSGNVFDPATMR
jgi:imidazolonepropionase-like amidohydrolase